MQEAFNKPLRCCPSAFDEIIVGAFSSKEIRLCNLNSNGERFTPYKIFVKTLYHILY